jgi:hypothetical protein
MCKLTVVRWCRPSTSSASESGWRPAIVKPGNKWLHLVHFQDGGGVSVSKVPASEAQHFQPLLYKGSPYPVGRAARKFLQTKKRRDITKAAMEILKEATA